MQIKIKDGFVVRQIAGSWVAVPTGERADDVSGLVTLSDSAAYLWNSLINWTTAEELLKKITDEYEIDEETAKKDIAAFISSLRDKNIIEE